MVLFGKFRQLEIVRGKQGQCQGFVVQMRGNAASQRQAVKGAGASADFIHQHQAVRGGAVQDLRGLGHFQHEGRLGVGQVIGRTDAGEDGINRADARAAGGHIAAHAGQQHDQGHLAHIGAFAAHIGAGDDLHALLARQMRVVGDEAGARGFHQAALHHGVAACGDVDAGLFGKAGWVPVQRQAAFGQGADGIQGGQSGGQILQGRYMGLQRVEQLLVQPFFARQCTVLGRQGFVFKGLEFRRDEAFGVFERLAALVVGRNLVKLPGCDFDVKAVHFVELHAQIGNAGALALTLLHGQQIVGTVGLYAAQLIQLGIKAVGNHAAVAHIDRWFGLQRGVQQLQHRLRRLQIVRNVCQQRCEGIARRIVMYLVADDGQQLLAQIVGLCQCAQQASQFAGLALAQGQPGADALYIADAVQGGAQIVQPLLAQQADGVQALLCLGAVALGVQQPVTQGAASHAAFASVQQAE